ncbi:MAG: hypothetical protein JSW56_16025 [Deltaproteobacteria bacterium]|nr:MAG: hypothetical protein JSW56_16025 [Deltaproteobacteria bacterium]
MKKWILIGACAVVVIIVVIVVLGLSNLGPIIKNAVNTYGPRITKTEVRLGDVDISILSAEAKLKDFFLGNPKGFKSPQAMKVGSIYANVDEKSLTGDTIIIKKIEVVRPDITYERTGRTDNFQAILNNVKGSASKSEPPKKDPAKPGKEGEGKKLVINNFILRQGKVNLALSTALGGKTITADLPDIHLKDIGKGKGGATPEEVFEKVFAALHKQITSPVVTDILNKELKTMGTSLDALSGTATKQLESIKAGDQEATKSVTDKVKGLFGK